MSTIYKNDEEAAAEIISGEWMKKMAKQVPTYRKT